MSSTVRGGLLFRSSCTPFLPCAAEPGDVARAGVFSWLVDGSNSLLAGALLVLAMLGDPFFEELV